MGSHEESTDAVASTLSGVRTLHAPVPMTRRETRAAEAMAQASSETAALGEASTAGSATVEAATPEIAILVVPTTEPVLAPRRQRAQLRATLPSAAEPLTSERATSSAGAKTKAKISPELKKKTSRTRRKSSRRAQAPQGPAGPPRGVISHDTRPHRKHRRTTRFFSVTAMVFVAAIAVATSVPANALLTAKEVDALNGAQTVAVAPVLRNGQTIEASGENVVAGRDGVSVSGAEPVKAYTDVSSNRIAPIVPNSTNPILWPFPSAVPLTDGFGPRAGIWTYGGYTGNFHSGQDFDPGYGTPIQAIADGIVTEVSPSLCGTAVVISHNVNNTKFDSEYCHMIYGSPGVSVGQSIMAGTIIGNVGQTGMATGPHLHLEIHVSGNAIDPLAFLRSHSKEW